jgi:arginyl-tRNA--protein-N-Asp/Glu arginylyltransferase
MLIMAMERYHGPHCTDDHQDDADRVYVEAVLIGAHRYGKAQYGPHCENHDACG